MADLFFIRCLALMLACLMSSVAVAADAALLKRIEVQGHLYVDKGAILNKISAKTGSPLHAATVSQDVRRLFATGLFEDVRVQQAVDSSGLTLTYVVKENPMISALSIEGNEEIPDKDLKPKLVLVPGKVYSKARLQIDRDRIRKAYLSKGFYQVNVQAETTLQEDGRVAVQLNVIEGEVTRIRDIRFIGNNHFSEADLNDVIASRETSFMTWITDKDVFKRDRFEADTQMLQQYYLEHGFMDAKVESMQLALTPDKTGFYLTFSIYEGDIYTVNQIAIQGDLVPSRQVLRDAVDMEQGDVYSLSSLRNSLDAMTLLVGDEGYGFATVTPLFKRDITNHTVDISFDVEKGREVYIDRIEVTGNVKTEDFVLRRELRQMEGERYSASKQKLSKDRLKRLGLFKDVRVSLPKADSDDRVDMKIEVEEDKTGTFSMGAGYSQIEKVFLTASVEERNFLGKGYTTNLSANLGGATQNYNVSVTEPYLLDSDISLTLDTFKTQTTLDSLTAYNQNDIGGGFRISVPMEEYLYYGLGYRFTRTNLSNIDPAATLLLRSQAGVNTLGEVTQSIVWDTRDHRMAPTEGVHARAGFGVAGLGGTSRFVESSASVSGYYSLSEGVVFRPRFEASDIRGYQGKQVPIYRRYSMGGIQSLRGFDSYGVTLRDPASNEVLGGNSKIRGSLDVFFPIPYVQTDGVRGVIYLDSGMVWGQEPVLNVTQNFLLSKLRVSSGIGMEWASPVGPISIGWSFPMKKQQGDLLRAFEFSLGAGF